MEVLYKLTVAVVFAGFLITPLLLLASFMHFIFVVTEFNIKTKELLIDLVVNIKKSIKTRWSK
jgi:hypothetical protein